MQNTICRLRPVLPEEAAVIYEQHMVRDFPDSERKPFAMIREGMERGTYDFLALQNGQGLAGYAALVAEPEQSAILLDYYAVLPTLRGSGAGTAGLALLRQYYAGKRDNILIESEHPDEAPDSALAERRLGFYTRAGCRATGIAERLFGVRYDIFSLDCSAQGAARSTPLLQNDLEALYRHMIPEPAFSLNVQFGDAALPPRPAVKWR